MAAITRTTMVLACLALAGCQAQGSAPTDFSGCKVEASTANAAFAFPVRMIVKNDRLWCGFSPVAMRGNETAIRTQGAVLTQPAHGRIAVYTNGAKPMFWYRPDRDYVGEDGFDVEVRSDFGTARRAVVVTVESGAGRPVGDEAAMPPNTVVTEGVKLGCHDPGYGASLLQRPSRGLRGEAGGRVGRDVPSNERRC